MKPDGDGSQGASSSSDLLLAESRNADARFEPTVTPCSALAVGIVLNEETKGWPASPVLKTRRNACTKVQLGTATQQELGREAPSILNSEPLPLMTITDVHMDFDRRDVHGLGREDPSGKDSALHEASVGVGLTVCGDAAVRIPEAIAMILDKETEFPLRGRLRARALLLTACSQTSYISNVAPTISASNANSAIASSKKIAVCACACACACARAAAFC